jgi:hypothetical protein
MQAHQLATMFHSFNLINLHPSLTKITKIVEQTTCDNMTLDDIISLTDNSTIGQLEKYLISRIFKNTSLVDHHFQLLSKLISGMTW